jgi:dipeptidyl aminopeptidase/acylaminoacyl peptidase
MAFAKLALANPDRGLIASNQFSGAYELCAWDVPGNTLQPMTGDAAGVSSGWISPDGSHVYFLRDEKGSELGHLLRVPFGGGTAEDLTPDMKPYTLRGIGFAANGRSVAFTAVNEDRFQLCFAEIDADGRISPARVIHRRQMETWGGPLSHDGSLSAAISVERAGGIRQYSLLAIDTERGEVVGELWDGPGTSVELADFSPLEGDSRALAMTTRTGFRRPVVWDPRTGGRRDLPLEDLEGEVLPLVWRPDGTGVLVCQIRRAKQRLYVCEISTGANTPVEHPEGVFVKPFLGVPGVYFGPYFDREGNICCLWQNSTRLPRVEVFSAGKKKPTRTLLTTPATVKGRPLRSVSFASSDGREVQGWLGLPDGQPPFPAIVHVHGGPHMVTADIFDPAAQSWLDSGFAYFTLNYRGSAMFGQDFKQKIWGDIGHWELEDIAAGHAWLVEQGLGHPEKIFLHGASYGGFLTLWGMGRRPDLWAGGLAAVSIADWVAAYEDASDALKAAMSGWHRGTLEEKRELYVERSPITYAEQVRAPILAFHGRADSRTPARQMELYETRLKSLGKQIEVVWYETGHCVTDPEQAVAFQQRRIEFARNVLAGQADTQ